MMRCRTRQCRSVQSIMGATQSLWFMVGNGFISVFLQVISGGLRVLSIIIRKEVWLGCGPLQPIRGIHMMLFISGLRALLIVLFCTMTLSSGQAAAGEFRGGPVLTITGKITETNRPAFNELNDVFFNFHKRTFEHAFAFDIASLEALGMRKARIDYPGWPAPVSIEGPFLCDVLAAAGAEEGTVRITALDGFTEELAAADMAEQD